MAHDSLRVEIDGAEVPELYEDLLGLEVELDDQLAGMVRLTVALLLRPDGSWTYLDDERFTPWRRIVVTAGLDDDSRQLLSGYLTHVRPDFGGGIDRCRVEFWGMDASVLLDREDRLKVWPNKKDSDIAAEVFAAHGLTPDVVDTVVVHDEELSTIVQRETDIQLLTRLALRNGYECFVDGDVGHFRPPAVDDPPQPVLAVHFGDETNVNRFSLEVDALAPSEVAMSGVHHLSGEVVTAVAEPGHQPLLGAEPLAPGPGTTPARVHIGQAVTTGGPEMTALCQGLYDLGEWFVTGEGEVSANKYGGILTPRSTVTIKGLGEAHSGVYYLTHVTHAFTADGYTQVFKVKRNALKPTGDETFDADTSGLLGGVL